MSGRITGAAIVAGVVGAPVRHSLSPVLHNAWIAAAGIDAAYVPFAPPRDHFARFVDGFRGAGIRGLNVTVPFKEQALAAADRASTRAKAAAAANLLIFEPDGAVLADNTDGIGLLQALTAQAPGFDPARGPVVILGAGGAARGAAAAFIQARAPDVRIVNRTVMRAEAVAAELGLPAKAYPLSRLAEALEGAAAVINATSAGLAGEGVLDIPLEAAPADAVAMDMVYKPLTTPFLARAQARGLRTVDGLEMLVRQAIPSFEAFYGRPPPEIDVREIALKVLEAAA